MALFRIAAAAGVVMLVAPHLPASLISGGAELGRQVRQQVKQQAGGQTAQDLIGREIAGRLGAAQAGELIDACRKAPESCAELVRHLPKEAMLRAAATAAGALAAGERKRAPERP